MPDVKTADPASRYGQVADAWGNLLLAPGTLEKDDLFRFQGDPADSPTFKVKRVLPFPLDAGKRLVYYEALNR